MSLRNELENRRLMLIERRLNEIGSMVKGNQAFQAERISDVLDQLEELRQELQRVAERQDKIAEWVKEKLANKNGTT